MQIGFSVYAPRLSDELLASLAYAGISTLELCATKNPEEELDPTSTVKWIESYGMTLSSYHVPYIPFVPWDISNPETADYCVQYFSEVMARWSAVGVKYFIVHPSGEPITEEERPHRMACAKESFRRLGEAADRCGVTVCVEDLPRTNLGNCASELLELCAVHPNLRICLDTNHFQGGDVAECIRTVGHLIARTHISDCDSINERHWLPGEGELDWQAILRAFLEVGYEGVWLYECGLVTENTILRERDLTPEDLVRNAREIFSGDTITVHGTPKPGLGMWE